jgi:hypothetical protein
VIQVSAAARLPRNSMHPSHQDDAHQQCSFTLLLYCMLLTRFGYDTVANVSVFSPLGASNYDDTECSQCDGAVISV